jgi:hypothetical protein
LSDNSTRKSEFLTLLKKGSIALEFIFAFTRQKREEINEVNR